MNSKKVKLKGARDGFLVTVDPGESYELIELEAGELFTNLRQLAKGARVSIETGLPGESHGLIEKLGAYLKTSFGVKEVVEKLYEESKGEIEPASELCEISGGAEVGDVKMLAGRVRSGQKVEAENHIVILGDVNPGGEVIAGGDILILGSLCGTAVAGQADNEKSIILALDFRPTQIQIAGMVAAGVGALAGKIPEYAFVEDGVIVVDSYVAANPFGKLPVLEER